MDNDSGIKFYTDSYKQSMPSFADETPAMVSWVIKISGGAIKDQRQAEYVLLGFVVIAIIVSLFLFSRSGPRLPATPPTPFQEHKL